MNDDLFLRAGAHLDAEIDPDSDAAQSDTAALEIVTEIERLRTLVKTVTPARRSDAERMISTAMAHFEESTVPAPHRPGPDRVRQLRPSAARVMGVAAASVAVLAVGFVAARSLQRSAEQDTAFDEAASFEVGANEPAEALIEIEASAESDDAARSVQTEDSLSMAVVAESPAADEPADEPAAEEPAQDPVGSTTPTGVASEERLKVEIGQIITTPEELGLLGTLLLADARAGVLPPTPNTRCPIAETLGWASYRLNGIVVEVLVAVDAAEGTVSAFDPERCEVVAVGPLGVD